MKQILLILFLLVLFCGCAKKEEETAEVTAAVTGTHDEKCKIK